MDYFLKKGEEVYGPTSLELLQAWAADGRIAPEDELATESPDKWTACYEISELDMNWKVELADGAYYGPVHILALKHSFVEGTIDPDVTVIDTEINQPYPLATVLAIGLIEQNRLIENRLEQNDLTVKRQRMTNNELRQQVASVNAKELEYEKRLELLETQNAKLTDDLETRQENPPAAEAEAFLSDPADRDRIKELEEKLAEALRNYETRKKQFGLLKHEVEALQTDKQALESEAQKLQPPEGDEPDSWMAVVNEKDQWEKGARKWEKLYQELSASSESDRASYNEQLADLKAGEIDNTSEVDNLNRRLEQLQSTYDSIQGGDAPKLADLKHAYDEQSVKFDAMLSQLDQKDGLLEEAILQRQDLEERLTQQMDHVRADVNQEREAAAESRLQLGQTQLDHRDLLKSYRELNDKYIQLKESSGIRHVPAQPSQATEPVMMTEPDPSTKSEPKMKKRLALGKKKSIVVNPEPEAKAQPAEEKAAAPENEIVAPPAEACEPKTVAPDKAPQKNGKRKQKKKKSGLRLK